MDFSRNDLSIILNCYDNFEFNNDKVILKVNPTLKYPSTDFPHWLQTIQESTLDVTDQNVVIFGRSPQSVCILLGSKLYSARTVTLLGLSIYPKFLQLNDDSTDHTYRVAVESKSKDLGPTVIYFTIKEENVISSEMLPSEIGVKHIITANPLLEGNSIVTKENEDITACICKSTLQDAMNRARELTSPNDCVYLATSTPLLLAVLFGVVVRENILDRKICLLDRSGGSSLYNVVWPC